MARCPTCDYPVPDDRERVGARCPSCREPLYEPAGRVARPARQGEPACALHLGMESVGVCFRCGQYVCETCRTRWRGQILCAACLTKAMASHEATPGQASEQRTQAFASLACGTAAWGISGLAMLALPWFDSAGPKAGVVAAFVTFLIVTGNVFVAAAGTGQAVAALRGEGPYRSMAFAGLAVSGLYAGVVLGAGMLGLWQN